MCACRNQLFFDFSKYRRNCKEYLKSQGRSEVLLSTISYTKSSVKPSWLGSSLACNIFSKSWFLCSEKSHIQKSGDVTTFLFCTIKKTNKISKAARRITHLQDMSSITDFFEEFCLKFPEHLFCRTHFSGCFLKLYYS